MSLRCTEIQSVLGLACLGRLKECLCNLVGLIAEFGIRFREILHSFTWPKAEGLSL